MIRQASSDEIATWDKLLAQNTDGGHILQSYEWARFKKSVDWEPNYFVYEQAGFLLYFVLACKPVSFLGNIYYCAKGPGFFKDFKLNKDSRARFVDFVKELKNFMADYDHKAILVKLEPELLDDEFNMSEVGLKKSKADLQFRATIFVDLSLSEEEILASFKQKTRYNIRLAARKGVKITRKEATDENIDIMYSLMAATQSRGGFFLRKREYFAGYYKALSKAGLGQLLFAEDEDEVLAGIFVTHFNKAGYYKDGGSYPIKRNLMAPYLLQWEGMRWAKEMGATKYDLVAVPPKAYLEDPEHPQAGLYQFKRGFNEEVTEFVGCWDLPISSNKYRIWLRQERTFLKLYNKMHKDLFW